VLHGGAAYWVLKDAPYRAHKNQLTGNPNAHIIAELLQLGFRIEVCNATLKGHGWTAQDVLPGVTIVHDGYTRLIDLQQRGYAYIYF
jgi:intracellular sulfur oxidation DsrE/DsrF family protein